MKAWLVIDVHYLCHRAFHVAKDLSWKGRPTGVIFGFLKSITWLKDELQTDRIAFCFEHPKNYRKDVYPPYKARRHGHERTSEEKASHSQLVIQICELRQRYLPQIGFKNIFCYHGMESDDSLAAIAKGCPLDEEVILVTGDSDLFQCIRSNVSIYSPQKRMLLTESWFRSKYGIPPTKWAVVKAIAGCATDEIAGIKGVGEVSALKYVRGTLPEHTKQYQAITSAEGKAIVRRNRALVELPYEGCPVPMLQEDQVSLDGWKEVCSLLGMRTIAGRPPVATRVQRRMT